MAHWPEKSPALVAVVDNVRSMHNVGAIFRAADGAGAGGLVLCGITACPPRNEIRKAALGAEEAVPWRYQRETLAAIRDLHRQGYFVVALESTESSQSLYDAQLQSPLALIVGHEFHGITEAALNEVDAVVHLPMLGSKISLNVSVAFGIAVYEIRRRLGF